MIPICIMEVRAGQHTSTIAQAVAHNASTMEGDLRMCEAVCAKRSDNPKARELVALAQQQAAALEATLLQWFELELPATVVDHGDGHGHERTHDEVVHHEQHLAQRYETR